MLTRRQLLLSWAAQARKPNVVFLVADDLGYGELACQGNPQIPTPHIDSIAAGGVRFTDGYVSAPFCCPSRAGFLTGRYQTRFGHELNATGKQNLDPNIGLPASEQTMGDHLRKLGYATGIFGKWHLGGTPKFHPQRRGFDEFFGFLHEGHFFVPPPYKGVTTRLRPNEPPYDDENFLMRGENVVEEKEYLTQAFTREALSFIDRNQSRPFFLYLPFNAVHSPMQALTADMKRFNGIGDEHRQVFAAMLSSLDEAVGAVLGRLRRHGLEQDTLVFFISDNGGPTAELTSGNGPLRGGKGQLYEGGIRVPFLAQWRGRIPGGQVVKEPVSALDILPTAVAAAGGAAFSAAAIDGVNLLPMLTREAGKLPRKNLFWRHGASIALREGKWKLVKQRDRNDPGEAYRLYDLSTDLAERNDLAAREPAVARALVGEMQRINREMQPPLWGRR
ncbi:MAG: sulfatase-like hydrolase/transferase [Acidobacteriia bacterium]|nr:sulfatase-like hydrolase/transferase [Terriglobia bacterium]